MNKLNNEICLVTGGAGFIGSHLVDQLIQCGAVVRVLDNLSNGAYANLQAHRASEKFQFIKGDVTDPLDVERAMTGVSIVFHLACLGVRHSLTHPYENHRVNAEGTLLLLDAAYRHGIQRFIHCSSSEVYGTAEYVPMPETHPTHPCTIYGASKLAGEAYARAYRTTYKLPTIVIRPFNTFGPRSHHEGDAGEVIPKSIVRALNGKNILVFGDGAQTRDFTYVEDTASAIITAAISDQLVGQTVNIGSRFEISIKELAEMLMELIANPEIRIEYLERRPGDVGRLFADPDKFSRLTNWKPKISFREGLNRTIAYFRNHPMGYDTLLRQQQDRNWQIA